MKRRRLGKSGSEDARRWGAEKTKTTRKIHYSRATKKPNHRPVGEGPEKESITLNQSRRKISYRRRPQCRLSENEAARLFRLDERRKKRKLQGVARQRGGNKESSENEGVRRYEI